MGHGYIDSQKILNEAIGKVLRSWGVEVNGWEVVHPKLEKFGDWTTNAALLAAKPLGKSPTELALNLKTDLEKMEEVVKIVDKIETTGPYLNITLKQEMLIGALQKMEIPQVGEGKTVVIDYSAPNIAKPFGIGHLRSTNIGQALYNLYSVVGWKCIGDNHLGDWGTQFGKLIVAIEKWGEGDEELTIEKLEKLYVKFHAEAQIDDTLIERAREKFAALEKGDEEVKKMWQRCVDISLLEFERVYKVLGVKIDYAYGEAFYQPLLNEVIEEVKKKGITTESQGATIVEFTKMPPALLVKSNGATTYFTRDLATLKFRKETWNPDLVIYEVGADQQLHFEQVFETGQMMGWFDKTQLNHVAHGLIRWADGKFSTREGKTIHLMEVIERATEEALTMAEDKDRSIAQKVAIGAIKFADLAQDPKKDIIFDWKKIMSLEGNSGPYLMYTVARINSLVSKSSQSPNEKVDKPAVEEMSLIRYINQWPEKVVEASDRLSPAVLAEYLVETAQKFNEFYNKYRIVGQPEESWRLYLSLKTAEVIKKGLALLGIETVERM
ncbi:MAG: arginine--tRNA ligase [Candidatus Shapirobacteria bacterium]